LFIIIKKINVLEVNGGPGAEPPAKFVIVFGRVFEMLSSPGSGEGAGGKPDTPDRQEAVETGSGLSMLNHNFCLVAETANLSS
jgi:hypothetical protein